MTEFLQPDYFAGMSDKFIRELKEKAARGLPVDMMMLREVYAVKVQREYAESFWLDAEEAERLTVFDDGTAEDEITRREYEGAPSWTQFIEYVRKGRG